MSDWKNRAEINADVVFFPYSTLEKEKKAEDVYVWDLDKTYLDTKFETIKGIVKTAFEKGFQKKNVPGTGALVRALKTSLNQKRPEEELAIYFITASPPQLEESIYEKLSLDGANPFGVFFKDNLQNLRPKRLWRLTKQVGYKLQSLMQLRLRLGTNVRQILWGDDSETDAVIYSLYSDICSRRIDEKSLVKILRYFHVVGTQVDAILELQSRLPVHDPVEKVYINLAVDTDSEYYLKFGRRLMASFNSVQTALDLFQDGRIGVEQVVDVTTDLETNFEFTTDEVEWSIDELVKRQILAEETIKEVIPVLKSHGLIHHQFELSMSPKPVVQRVQGRVYELEGSFEPWVPEHIDYMHDYR